uniref:Uncharacterized protein n=1 Tax=Amorphochlora amoebiformis TaxID=1561963 RepID=A0A7S0GPZ5_9EUKA|mmetsp:Transcript_1323/g.1860  ORF Transcript_1323/g.1860 Transcript_1323/m.1860 type:complete len:240 (+) Transcript_1323:356-1075(+)
MYMCVRGVGAGLVGMWKRTGTELFVRTRAQKIGTFIETGVGEFTSIRMIMVIARNFVGDMELKMARKVFPRRQLELELRHYPDTPTYPTLLIDMGMVDPALSAVDLAMHTTWSSATRPPWTPRMPTLCRRRLTSPAQARYRAFRRQATNDSGATAMYASVIAQTILDKVGGVDAQNIAHNWEIGPLYTPAALLAIRVTQFLDSKDRSYDQSCPPAKTTATLTIRPNHRGNGYHQRLSRC